jgi:HTH-type transcriptional regulator / antitoxin HipB
MLLHTPDDFGRVVRDRRRAIGMTQAELAERSGVSRYWLGMVEQGKSGAEIGLLLKVFHVLGLRLTATGRMDAEGDAPDGNSLDTILAGTRGSRR